MDRYLFFEMEAHSVCPGDPLTLCWFKPLKTFKQHCLMEIKLLTLLSSVVLKMLPMSTLNSQVCKTDPALK